MKNSLIRFTAGLGIAAAIGAATLGIGTATSNAAPATAVHTEFAEWCHGWGHGPGPWRPGPRHWGGYGYGYGGWNGYGYGPPPCVSGPLGFVNVCA